LTSKKVARIIFYPETQNSFSSSYALRSKGYRLSQVLSRIDSDSVLFWRIGPQVLSNVQSLQRKSLRYKRFEGCVMTHSNPLGPFHVSVQGTQYGPISLQQLEVWIREGRLQGDSLCWVQGWPSWLPIQQVFPQYFQIVSDPVASAPVGPPPGPPPGPPSGLPAGPPAGPASNSSIGPPSGPPPAPQIQNASGKKGISPILIVGLLIVVIAALSVGGWLIFSKFRVGGAFEVQGLDIACTSAVLYREGEQMELESVGMWRFERQTRSIQSGVEDQADHWIQNGSKLTWSHDRTDAFSGSDIQESIAVEFDSDWMQILSFEWRYHEKNEMYTVEKALSGSLIDCLNPGKEVRVFRVIGAECKERLVLSETSRWPRNPEFDQGIETVLWGDQSLFELKLLNEVP